MSGLRVRDFSIAANLQREIDERNDDAKRADDLPEIGQVVEIHALQLVVVGQALHLPKPKMATDAVALQLELTFVIGAVEMAFRF